MVVIFAFLIFNFTCQFVIFEAMYFRNFDLTRPLAVSLFDLSAVLNSTINVVIYGFFDKKFKKHLKKIICPCMKVESSDFDSSTRETTRKQTLIKKTSVINDPKTGTIVRDSLKKKPSVINITPSIIVKSSTMESKRSVAKTNEST